MAATDTVEEEMPKKSGKAALIVGVVLALVAGAGGYFAAVSGMLPFGAGPEPAMTSESEHLKPIANTEYIPLDPLIVSIRSSSQYRLLRFTGQLEVAPEHASEIRRLKPRIVDVMNTYLNAIEARVFEDPVAMMKLRAQLLRRIQIVTGQGLVKDLLIMEFVLQ